MTSPALETSSNRIKAMATNLGVALIVAPSLMRTMVAYDPMPIWSTDPFILWMPHIAVGPAAMLTFDALTIFGAALVLLSARSGRPLAAAILFALAAVPIFLHSSHDQSHLEAGSPWLAAASAAIAIAHLPRHGHCRVVVFATVMSLVVIFAARGFVQVFIEHAATVADYELQREAFLASRGWSPDSMMARNYERRLYQPEASGWFGLANVYATFAAAFLAAFAVLLWRALQIRDDRRPLIVVLAAVICAAIALFLAGSKGAFGALLLAILAFVVLVRFGKRGQVVVALVPVAALAAIVMRGLVGERIPELSLLFRWFYIQGATSIFLDHPFLGVGPAGFKDAYILAKPPLSPEEVQSPHSIFYDYLASLGLFAIALIILIAAACRSLAMTAASNVKINLAGKNVVQEPGIQGHRPTTASGLPSSTNRRTALIAFSFVGLALAYSALAESQLVTISMALARFVALLIAFLLIAAITQIASRDPRAIPLASAAAALVVLAHTQVEVTGVWISSTPLAGIFLGIACMPYATTPRSLRIRAIAIALIFLPILVFIGHARLTLARWENCLKKAAFGLEQLNRLQAEIELPPPHGPAALSQIAAMAGTTRARTAAELADQFHTIQRQNLAVAINWFEAASDIRPSHLPTRQTAARLNYQQALLDDSPTAAAAAIRHAQAGADLNPGSPAAFATLSAIYERLADRPDLAPDSGLQAAIAAMEHAAALDPHGLNYPVRLVSLYERAGNLTQAAHYAGIAIENHAKHRLDPLRQLTPAEHARLSAIAGTTEP